MRRCARKHCTGVGAWIPVISLWAKDYYGEPAKAHLDLPHCEVCKRLLGLSDLLATEEQWEKIESGFALARRSPPDRSRTTLTWAGLPGGAE